MAAYRVQWGRVWFWGETGLDSNCRVAAFSQRNNDICFLLAKWGKLKFLPNHLLTGSHTLLIPGWCWISLLSSVTVVEVLSYPQLCPLFTLDPRPGRFSTSQSKQRSHVPPGANGPASRPRRGFSGQVLIHYLNHSPGLTSLCSTA